MKLGDCRILVLAVILRDDKSDISGGRAMDCDWRVAAKLIRHFWGFLTCFQATSLVRRARRFSRRMGTDYGVIRG